MTSFYFNNKNKVISGIEDALKDLHWAIVEFNAENLPKINNDKTNGSLSPIDRFRELKNEFEVLLNNAKKEEEIQVFLKNNPVILGPHSLKMDKSKLGEDFVTDFVLVNRLDQGKKYTMVEIERPSMQIFRQSEQHQNNFSGDFTHATDQILEWDTWLEENQDYFRRRHDGFESPEYLIIAGRSIGLSESQRARIRAWNRQQAKTKFYTYDDIVVRFEEQIELLEKSSK